MPVIGWYEYLFVTKLSPAGCKLRENLRRNIYRLVCVVTEHTFMLGSIFGKQSTCLNADGVGVNCIFVISFMSWHDDMLKYNSRSVSCLSLSSMQLQTFSKTYVGLAGAGTL